MSSPKIIKEPNYTNGYRPNINTVPPNQVSGCDRQKIGQGWGIVLTVISVGGILAGGALIASGAFKFKAIPMFTDNMSIGIGAGIVAVSGLTLTGGIVLISKNYWKDPAYAEKVRDKIKNSDYSFSTIMARYPLEEIRDRHIVSEKLMAMRFLAYVEEKKLSFTQIVHQFGTAANNQWKVKILGDDALVSPKVLEELVRNEILGTCKNVDGRIDPQMVAQKYGALDPVRSGIIPADFVKEDYCTIARNYTYQEMKAIDVKILPMSERTKLLQQQHSVDFRHNFDKFKAKHGQGVWEMVSDGVVTARTFREYVLREGAMMVIPAIINRFGVEVFYVDPSASNQGDRSHDALCIIHNGLEGWDWSNRMDQEILAAGTFSILVATFSGDATTERWGHIDTLLKAGMGSRENYRAVLLEEIKPMTFAQITARFGLFNGKVFREGFLRKEDPILKEKFIEEIRALRSVKTAREKYPQAFNELLTKKEKAALILEEIHINGVNYDQLLARFGFDIFMYVEPKELVIIECFERYVSTHGFCNAWEKYCLTSPHSVRGNSHLRDHWLAKIHEANGVEFALNQARGAYDASIRNANATYEAANAAALAEERNVVEPLQQRVSDLVASINREEVAYNQQKGALESARRSAAGQKEAEIARVLAQRNAAISAIQVSVGGIENRMREHQRTRVPVRGEGQDPHMFRLQAELTGLRRSLESATAVADRIYIPACANINGRYQQIDASYYAQLLALNTAYTGRSATLLERLRVAKETLRGESVRAHSVYVHKQQVAKKAQQDEYDQSDVVLAQAKGSIDAYFANWLQIPLAPIVLPPIILPPHPDHKGGGAPETQPPQSGFQPVRGVNPFTIQSDSASVD